MTVELVYETLETISPIDFDAIIASGSPDERRIAIFQVAETVDDYGWLVDRLRHVLTTETDPDVLSAAILGIGCIARRFRYADERVLKGMLRPLAKANRPIGELDDAQSDIYVYLSRHRRKRKRELRKAAKAGSEGI